MLKDKPVRIIGVYLGEGRRKATVYQDLVTKQYIASQETEGFSGSFTQMFDSLDKAEDFAEDWVL
jgi:hypothetical protein